MSVYRGFQLIFYFEFLFIVLSLQYLIVAMAAIILLSTASGYFFGIIGLHISVVKTTSIDDATMFGIIRTSDEERNNPTHLRNIMAASTDSTSGSPHITFRQTPRSPLGKPIVVLPPAVIGDPAVVQQTEACRYLSGQYRDLSRGNNLYQWRQIRPSSELHYPTTLYTMLR